MANKGGDVLEVLLVSAEHLNRSTLLGYLTFSRRSRLYVNLQCGDEIYGSKITTGKDRRAWWNEKFIFEIPSSASSTCRNLSLKIMQTDFMSQNNSLGEATIDLEGIISEGHHRGSLEVKPAPYNIVLPCGTFAGEIKVGLKFNPNGKVIRTKVEKEECYALKKKPSQPFYLTIIKCPSLKFPWAWPPSLTHFCTHATANEDKKSK